MDISDWIVSSESLREMLQSSTPPLLLDVREQEEFDEVAFPGAVLIPLGELQNKAEKLLKPEQEIVVYCAHGVRSLQGLMALRMLGFENLKSLQGGIFEYLEQYPDFS